jgi:hypothetical protein
MYFSYFHLSTFHRKRRAKVESLATSYSPTTSTLPHVNRPIPPRSTYLTTANSTLSNTKPTVAGLPIRQRAPGDPKESGPGSVVRSLSHCNDKHTLEIHSTLERLIERSGIWGIFLLEDSAQEGFAAVGPGVQVVLDDAAIRGSVGVDRLWHGCTYGLSKLWQTPSWTVV